MFKQRVQGGIGVKAVFFCVDGAYLVIYFDIDDIVRRYGGDPLAGLNLQHSGFRILQPGQTAPERFTDSLLGQRLQKIMGGIQRKSLQGVFPAVRRKDEPASSLPDNILCGLDAADPFHKNIYKNDIGGGYFCFVQ